MTCESHNQTAHCGSKPPTSYVKNSSDVLFGSAPATSASSRRLRRCHGSKSVHELDAVATTMRSSAAQFRRILTTKMSRKLARCPESRNGQLGRRGSQRRRRCRQGTVLQQLSTVNGHKRHGHKCWTRSISASVCVDAWSPSRHFACAPSSIHQNIHIFKLHVILHSNHSLKQTPFCDHFCNSS